MPGKEDRPWTKGESGRSVIDKNIVVNGTDADECKTTYTPNNGPCYKFEVKPLTYNINILVDPDSEQWNSDEASALDADEQDTIEVDRQRGKPMLSLGIENLASTACTVHVRSFKWFDEV